MIKILGSAHIKCKNSILVLNGDENVTTIGCFAFLIRCDNEYVLIDTGIEDIDVVNKTKSSKDDWKRAADEFSILEHLNNLGIDCNEITKVLITHSHYDHLSGIMYFKNAKIYMSEAEYDYLNSRNPHRDVLKKQIAFLKENKPILFKDSIDITEHIKGMCVGAHTPGSVIYTVGNNIFTGDNVYLLDAVSESIPIGYCENSEEAKKAVEICKNFDGNIFTSHDLKCLKNTLK